MEKRKYFLPVRAARELNFRLAQVGDGPVFHLKRSERQMTQHLLNRRCGGEHTQPQTNLGSKRRTEHARQTKFPTHADSSRSRDQFGPGNKSIAPTVAGGKVFVGTNQYTGDLGAAPIVLIGYLPSRFSSLLSVAFGFVRDRIKGIGSIIGNPQR
jgi:hypothetical protein